MSDTVGADLFAATMQGIRQYIETAERDISRLEEKSHALDQEVADIRQSLAEAREQLAALSGPKRSRMIDQSAPAVGGGAIVAAAVAILEWLRGQP